MIDGRVATLFTKAISTVASTAFGKQSERDGRGNLPAYVLGWQQLKSNPLTTFVGHSCCDHRLYSMPIIDSMGIESNHHHKRHGAAAAAAAAAKGAHEEAKPVAYFR